MFKTICSKRPPYQASQGALLTVNGLDLYATCPELCFWFLWQSLERDPAHSRVKFVNINVYSEKGVNSLATLTNDSSLHVTFLHKTDQKASKHKVLLIVMPWLHRTHCLSLYETGLIVCPKATGTYQHITTCDYP